MRKAATPRSDPRPRPPRRPSSPSRSSPARPSLPRRSRTRRTRTPATSSSSQPATAPPPKTISSSNRSHRPPSRPRPAGRPSPACPHDQACRTLAGRCPPLPARAPADQPTTGPTTSPLPSGCAYRSVSTARTTPRRSGWRCTRFVSSPVSPDPALLTRLQLQEPITINVQLPEYPDKPEWGCDGSNIAVKDVPLTLTVGAFRERVAVRPFRLTCLLVHSLTPFVPV